MVNTLLKERVKTHFQKGCAENRTNSAGDEGNIDPVVTPADRTVHTSPAEVMRKVGSQLDGGFRRTLDAQVDLISAHILDLQSADDLVRRFIHRQGRFLLVQDERDMTSGGELRHVSPFLHAVCCLQELKYTAVDGERLIKHRLAFEHVRKMLGVVMLAGPLPLEELTGVFIMAFSSASPSRGSEFLDSWLLSGHCAQQAMLSIKFSEIGRRTKLGTSTLADQKSIRLWANICLVHLHWAATTGRPSTLPGPYFRQCRVLLDFELATLRDTMLYAEITLYSIIEEKLSRESFLESDGACEELTGWKQKWSHLLELPNSLVLSVSYEIAWLILASRSLEHSQSQDSERSSQISDSDTRAESGGRTSSRTMQSLVCDFAAQVLAIFLTIPESWGADLPDFYLFSSHGEIVQHLELVKRRYGDVQSMPKSMRYSVEKALKRLRRNTSYSQESSTSLEREQIPHQDESIGNYSECGVRVDSDNPSSTTQEIGNQQAVFTTALLDPMDLQDPLFEGMEYFFSGGYLGPLDHSGPFWE
ncbi:hypothetical protein MPH_02703 [Macrophomina phaseolina MS6]|uniref:Transcription factor domain-containing protein n=1 Tax=Macrophomina phaseolina (strain MS6) TaxID=1126212 RepID=K2RZ24_MACPH|nr:hypothetical protein MPH_02703 [Macrophomina phaseolina MS6]